MMVELYPTFSDPGSWLLASGSSPVILAFGFATPVFLGAGALLAAIPIIIHILNRRRFKTVKWAAMEFLLRAMRRNRRRLKFEQWLLLAVRCLLLFFLGLALARPLGCDRSSLAMLAQRSGLHVLVIDNSYSMAYEADRPDAKTHLDQAKILAKAVIDRLTAGGESVAIITAARPATAVIATPAYDLQAAKDAVDRIEQSYSDTDLAGALQKANEIGQEESKQPARFLHLFTDATRSAWEPPQKDPLSQAGRDAARLFKITHHNLARGQQSNSAVEEVRPTSNLVRAKFNNDFTTTLRGFGSTGESALQWRLDGQIVPGSGATLRPQPDTAPQTLAGLQMREGGPHVITASLATDDRLKIDDARWRVVEVASELKVLIVEGERGIGAMAGSGAFLNLALAPPAEAGSAAVPRGRNTSS
ncbi:MAG TPA: BatA domain-containing protein, partial [Tepidisphaeraceae bacterium]|nr:BatA domain-containing protein [Tepidisphaeraceae bacterium]